MQDVLSLFLTRVFTVAFIILTALMVEAGFPFSPGHISLLTLLTVGIPTFGLALWAKPGAAPASLGRSLVRFVLPASITLGVAAFAVYALAYFFNDLDLIGLRGGGVLAVTEVPLADRIARDSLAHILILAGLVLVFFAAPPTKWWAVLEETNSDWRPALLSLAMVPLYVDDPGGADVPRVLRPPPTDLGRLHRDQRHRRHLDRRRALDLASQRLRPHARLRPRPAGNDDRAHDSPGPRGRLTATAVFRFRACRTKQLAYSIYETDLTSLLVLDSMAATEAKRMRIGPNEPKFRMLRFMAAS